MERATHFVCFCIQSFALVDKAPKFIRVSSEGPVQGAFRNSISIHFDPAVAPSELKSLVNQTALTPQDDLVVIDVFANRRTDIASTLLLAEDRIAELCFIFHESAAINQKDLRERLIRDTAFGLGSWAASHLKILGCKIFIGANAEPACFMEDIPGPVAICNDIPYTIQDAKEDGVNVRALDSFGRLVSCKEPLFEYLGHNEQQLAERFKFRPKHGISIRALSINRPSDGSTQFKAALEVKKKVAQLFQASLREHQKHQLMRVQARLDEFGGRQEIRVAGSIVGVVPQNELETILLFDRISRIKPSVLPFGLKLTIKDLSARGIDAICLYSPQPASPAILCVVEFEYKLKSFFDHGHDINQVKLVICYTAGDLTFPLDFGGRRYDFVTTAGLPQIRCSAENASVDCLIISDYFPS